MDNDRLQKIIEDVSNHVGVGQGLSSTSSFDIEEVIRLIEQAVSIQTETERIPITDFDNNIGLVIFGMDRTIAPKSYKFHNITREVSRTVYVTLLIGAASLAGTVATAVSIAYALFTATSANVGFSDACVLHKAWQLAGKSGQKFISKDQLISVKNDISEEYNAPKFKSDTEILDAILNLIGLKAIEERDGNLHLKEKIICFSDGTISN